MKQCKRCGSYAINHGHHGRDGSDRDLCDVCYWRKRAEKSCKSSKEITSNKPCKPTVITLEKVVQWAKEAKFEASYLCQGYWLCTPEQIKSLVIHAQNEAYENAAQMAEVRSYMSENFLDHAEELREQKVKV